MVRTNELPKGKFTYGYNALIEVIEMNGTAYYIEELEQPYSSFWMIP